METVIVIMLKNKKTGFLEKEITCLPIVNNEDLLLNAYAVENESNIEIILKITTPDVLDWEYYAIYDNYDTNILKKEIEEIKKIEEIETEYNPTWELTIQYDGNDEKIKSIISKILGIHNKELICTHEKIKNKKGEYENE